MADDGKDPVDSKPSTASKQNEKLYAAEGILNPRKRRAEKKRRKAQKFNYMHADYDFKVDYHMREVGSDVSAAGEDDANEEVPTSGVEVDA